MDRQALHINGSIRRCLHADILVCLQFISSLLEKFQEQSSGQEAANDGAYARAVALGLGQSLMDNATHVENECPICLECPLVHDACMTACAHVFCSKCLLDVLKESGVPSLTRKAPESDSRSPDGLCPVCQSKVKSSDIILLSKEEGRFTSVYLKDKEQPTASPGGCVRTHVAKKVLEKAVRGTESSKLAAVVREMHVIWSLDPRSSILLFSQFLGFLDFLEARLQSEGIPCRRLDGSMSLKERVAALDAFEARAKHSSNRQGPSTKNGQVMLVSMRAGGVGLNLVSASSVFITDPWWNASVGKHIYSL